MLRGRGWVVALRGQVADITTPVRRVDTMRVVVCHNYFRERGGEDQVFEDELGLLEAGGHDVTPFIRRNTEFAARDVIPIAMSTPWNRQASHDIAELVRETNAEVVHFHNWLPQISPGAFYAARKAGAAVVQTLHNYRWACPKGIMFREGRPCEECMGKVVPWPAVAHGCYRGSRSGSAVVTTALSLHNVLRTPQRVVDAYVAASEFIRDKLTEAGLPRERIYLKPNFLSPDPGTGSGSGDYAMYLGRLSPEKEIGTLLDAWARLDGSVPLKISGDGPLRPQVEAAAGRDPSIEYLGFAPNETVDRLLGEARFLVFPSGTYEVQPITILESFAKGTPVVAGRIGAMADLVDDGVTGWHFESGDAPALADTVSGVFGDLDVLAAARAAARAEYEKNYRVEGNLDMLIDIYRSAIARRRRADGEDR
jgi:glycosyltransferase involved in cell wall biosynthesis